MCLVRGASTLKSILFIVCSIVRNFYTQVCFCFSIFIVFLNRFIIMKGKLVKGGSLKTTKNSVFNVEQIFFHQCVLDTIVSNQMFFDFWLLIFLYTFSNNCIKINHRKKTNYFETLVWTKNIFKNRRTLVDWRVKDLSNNSSGMKIVRVRGVLLRTKLFIL